METVVIVGFAATIYFLAELKNKVARQSNILDELSEKLSTLEDKLSEIQSELANVESAIDTITPDSARIDELVRLGVDRADAIELVLTKEGERSALI